MDAKVRDKLAEFMKTYQLPKAARPGRAAYCKALQMAQEITGSYPEALETEHYYAPVPGDKEDWCAVCAEAPTYAKHRGSSSAAKDFIIGAFELYTQIMRYHGETLSPSSITVTAEVGVYPKVNATETDLMLDCSA